MEIKDILTLIEAVSQSRLSSFSYEEGDVKLAFEAKCEGMPMTFYPADAVQTEKVISHSEQTKTECCNIITSPMVGTFYLSGTEDGEPFITVGETVKRGQVVGIVEAMKLMNEIESPYDGVVEAILVKNKDMIGFGQELIKVRPL